MNKNIQKKVIELGGSFTGTDSATLVESLLSIKIESPLYKKPSAKPWSDNPEPIYGLSDYVDQNMTLYRSDKDLFYKNMIKHFFYKPEGDFGQTYLSQTLFTPFTQGTDDYEEWNDYFEDSDVNLNIYESRAVVEPLEFMILTFNDGYPSAKYICTSDTEIKNPMVFATDHTVFFSEVSQEGHLEDFLNTFMSEEEFLQIVKPQMEEHYQ